MGQSISPEDAEEVSRGQTPQALYATARSQEFIIQARLSNCGNGRILHVCHPVPWPLTIGGFVAPEMWLVQRRH